MIGLSDKAGPSGRDWAVVYGLDAAAGGTIVLAVNVPGPWTGVVMVVTSSAAIVLSVFTAATWWQMRGAPAPQPVVRSRPRPAVEGRRAPIRVKASAGSARRELPSKVG